MLRTQWQDNPDHPMLVDLNTGTLYEWTEGQETGHPHGPMTEGYANTDDHDWVWTREALESEASLEIAEWRSLDERQHQQLRELYEDSQPD